MTLFIIIKHYYFFNIMFLFCLLNVISLNVFSYIINTFFYLNSLMIIYFFFVKLRLLLSYKLKNSKISRFIIDTLYLIL